MSGSLPEVQHDLVPLELDADLWSRVFTVAPLVLVGTRDAQGKADQAPKHMVTPLGFGPWFAFVCSPTHTTYWNVVETRCFTVTWLRPDQVLQSGLAAAPRCGPDKPSLAALSTFPAREVEADLVEGGYLFFECALDRVLEGFGNSVLIIGKVLAAHAAPDALRAADRDDNDLVREVPLLAYLHPGRFASIDASQGFPLPQGFQR